MNLAVVSLVALVIAILVSCFTELNVGILSLADLATSAKTGQAFGELVEGGLEPHAAWEAVREEWAFLPAEADTAEEPWWSEEGVSENDA